MLLNLSNHPFKEWDETQQKEAINRWGSVSDLAFPQINPLLSSLEINQLAKHYASVIIPKYLNQSAGNAIHLMGEITFCFSLANLLISSGYICVVSTTERKSETHNGIKKSIFRFIRFREY
jgi:hypothetical protein